MTNPGPDVLRRLEALPRTELSVLPTPLRRAENLRRALGPDAPEVWIKHDDLTGFGLGGNKVRKLEHELAPDRLEGVTHLVTSGGAQSNHCRVTAAAAARLGLGCVLVVNGDPGDPPTGNALLHRLLGADVRRVGDREERAAGVEAARREIEARGGRPLVVPLGASTPTGALGYLRAAVELDRQLTRETAGADGRTALFVASSSAGTLGGLTAGRALLDREGTTLVGVSADVGADELLGSARELALGALRLLGGAAAEDGRTRLKSRPEWLRVTDREVGGGYGIPTEASREAARLWARSEGVILDPVYTAKAAAAVVRATREGELAAYQHVVFLHTGGHPALFAPRR